MSNTQPFSAAKLSYKPLEWLSGRVHRAVRFLPSPSWLAEATQHINTNNNGLVTWSPSLCRQHRGPDQTAVIHQLHCDEMTSPSLQEPYEMGYNVTHISRNGSFLYKVVLF